MELRNAYILPKLAPVGRTTVPIRENETVRLLRADLVRAKRTVDQLRAIVENRDRIIADLATKLEAAQAGESPKLKTIREAVARTPEGVVVDITTPRRTSTVATYRHVFFAMASRLCRQESIPAIAHAARRDHTTVLYGIKRAEQMWKEGREPYCDIRDRALAILGIELATFEGGNGQD